MTWVETTGALKVEEEKTDAQNVGAAVTGGHLIPYQEVAAAAAAGVETVRN